MKLVASLPTTKLTIEVGPGSQSVRWFAGTACQLYCVESGIIHVYCFYWWSHEPIEGAHVGSLAPSYVVAEGKLVHPDTILKNVQLPSGVLTIVPVGAHARFILFCF